MVSLVGFQWSEWISQLLLELNWEPFESGQIIITPPDIKHLGGLILGDTGEIAAAGIKPDLIDIALVFISLKNTFTWCESLRHFWGPRVSQPRPGPCSTKLS